MHFIMHLSVLFTKSLTRNENRSWINNNKKKISTKKSYRTTFDIYEKRNRQDDLFYFFV